jgi:hypothetical protein
LIHFIIDFWEKEDLGSNYCHDWVRDFLQKNSKKLKKLLDIPKDSCYIDWSEAKSHATEPRQNNTLKE